MKIEELRNQINSLDREIIEKISMRLAIAQEIGGIKKEKDLPIKDQEREEIVISRIRKIAHELILDPDVFEKIYRIIIDESCNIQEKVQ